MKKSSSTAEIIDFMQSKSGQSQKEVCLIIAEQGSLANRHMVYLHDSDPFGSIENHRKSEDLVGFVWYASLSEERPKWELLDENVGDENMSALINEIVASIHKNQMEARRRLQI